MGGRSFDPTVCCEWVPKNNSELIQEVKNEKVLLCIQSPPRWMMKSDAWRPLRNWTMSKIYPFFLYLFSRKENWKEKFFFCFHWFIWALLLCSNAISLAVTYILARERKAVTASLQILTESSRCFVCSLFPTTYSCICNQFTPSREYSGGKGTLVVDIIHSVDSFPH